MPSTSTLPKADAPRLPCPAHALGHGLDRGALVAREVQAEPASETGQARPPETYLLVLRAVHFASASSFA
jgi:polyhydroxyalkanoate synthase subunit PhaC